MGLFGLFSRYIAWQYLVWFLFFLTVFLTLVLLVDTLELLRRASGKEHIPLSAVLYMGVLKLPRVGQKIIPFVILFSAMITLWRLTRSQELVVARAVGISAWQFLTPLLFVAFMVGVIRVTVIHPLGAHSIAEFNRLEEFYFDNRTDNFEISSSGLWLRQQTETDEYFIHAAAIDGAEKSLKDVLVIKFEAGNRYKFRIDADTALLMADRWRLQHGVLRAGNLPPKSVDQYDIPTSLTVERLEESFASPETISFWGLPRFIQVLEQTGFSSLRHRLHYQSLLGQPFLYCAMVLLAAVFSLRQIRSGGTLLMVSGGVITGFAVFIFTDVILSVGMSEAIPPFLAAWAPAGISLLLGGTALLHAEDG